MSSPLVSVILPVHNGGPFLQDALRSVLQQSLTDFELIVVDDCSSDESASIAGSFGDPRIRLIRSLDRLRICKALNLGIENARGEFLARMDADDLCRPERLERQVRFLDRHPQIGFCGSWVMRFGEHQPAQLYRRPVGFPRIHAFALFDSPMIHSTVMIRRKALQHLDAWYQEDFVDAEDYDLWNRLFEFTECDNLPEVLLDYRVHTQSVTLRKTESMDLTACRIQERELIKLGLKLTKGEVIQHRRWATGRLDIERDSKDIDRAEKWLMRLMDANLASQTYDPKAVLWAMREVWFALCYRVQAASKPILERFITSAISRNDLKHIILLTGAIIKHRLRERSGRSKGSRN